MILRLFTSVATGKQIAINPDRVTAVQRSLDTDKGVFTVIKINENFAYHVKEDFDTVIKRLPY